MSYRNEMRMEWARFSKTRTSNHKNTSVDKRILCIDERTTINQRRRSWGANSLGFLTILLLLSSACLDLRKEEEGTEHGIGMMDTVPVGE